jgi:predicted HTH transcriptional regulator
LTKEAIRSWEEFCDLDITSGRHGGNEESRAAFEGIRHSLRDKHREILRIFERNGDMSAKEIALALGQPLNCASGRISELKALCYLEPTGLRRNGSRVLRRTTKAW